MGNALPGVLYATVMLSPTEVKAYHEFKYTDEDNMRNRPLFVCTKCGLRARQENGRMYVIYPHPIGFKKMTGGESCAEIIIWDIIE